MLLDLIFSPIKLNYRSDENKYNSNNNSDIYIYNYNYKNNIFFRKYIIRNLSEKLNSYIIVIKLPINLVTLKHYSISITIYLVEQLLSRIYQLYHRS